MSTVSYSYHAGDLFHAGHLHQLEQAKRLTGATYLVVGLLTDEAIAAYKPGRPIVPFELRRRVYEALEIVDLVVRQDNVDPTEVLKIIRPDFLSHGDDWDEILGTEWMLEHGGKVVKTPYFEALSTTSIIERIGLMLKKQWE